MQGFHCRSSGLWSQLIPLLDSTESSDRVDAPTKGAFAITRTVLDLFASALVSQPGRTRQSKHACVKLQQYAGRKQLALPPAMACCDKPKAS